MGGETVVVKSSVGSPGGVEHGDGINVGASTSKDFPNACP